MPIYDSYLNIEPTHWGAWLQRRRARAEWEIIHKYYPASKSFLEIGPGHGVMAKVATESGLAYYAIESNERIARFIRKSGYTISSATAPPFPIQTESMDIVYAAHVIEHLPTPSAALSFAQESHRVLRKNGVFFISAPDIRSFGSNFWDADYTHSFPVTPRRLRQLLSDANFDTLHVLLFSGPFHGPIGGLLSALAKFIPSNLFFSSGESAERLDRIRLTFLRNVCVVARKY